MRQERIRPLADDLVDLLAAYTAGVNSNQNLANR
jgi:hypothetical protein